MRRTLLTIVMLTLAAGLFYLGFLRPMVKRPQDMLVLHDAGGRRSVGLFSTAWAFGVEHDRYLAIPLVAPPGVSDRAWTLQQTYDHQTWRDYGILAVEGGLPLVPDVPEGSRETVVCVGYGTTVFIRRSGLMLGAVVTGGIGLWQLSNRRRKGRDLPAGRQPAAVRT